jgi:hypothetical protein
MIKLRRLSERELQPGKYTVTLPGPINTDLLAYIDAYKEAYDDAVAPDAVIAAIIAQFLAADGAFQQWKREREGASATRARRRRNAEGHGPRLVPGSASSGAE